MLIGQTQLRDAADRAHFALQVYLGSSTLGPRVMLYDEAKSGPNVPFPVWFARFAGGAPVQRFKRAVPAGFGSWLMRMQGPRGFVPVIAVNTSQIDTWARPRDRKTRRFWQDVITARCVIHEVGHILLHPHLLKGPAASHTLARKAGPAEEEQAWVFAFIVIGMIIGDYAEACRDRRSCDDSPTRIV